MRVKTHRTPLNARRRRSPDRPVQTTGAGAGRTLGRLTVALPAVLRRQLGLEALAWGLLAASAPVALVAVPLYFNPRTERVFEPDKLAWIVWLALLTGLAMATIGLHAPFGRETVLPGLRRVPPLAWAVLLTLGLMTAATVASPVPSVSLWGAYRRGHGLLVHASYVTLCFGLALAFRLPGAASRIRYALLLPVTPVTLYALLQRFGVDSIPWRVYGSSTLERPFGPMGNPIFLGAYLAMVAPLALADLFEQRASVVSPAGRPRQVFDGVVAGLAVLGVLASGSRGPLLGLGTGLLFLAVLGSARRGRRGLALALVACAAITALALALLGQSQQGGHRLLDVLSPTSRTAQERILLWRALADLARTAPARIWLGYGPQNLAYVLPPHLPDALIRLAPGQTFDSAHNVIWEWWISAGILGVLAILVLYAGAFWVGMNRLGLAATSSHRRWLVGSLLGGTVLGALAVFLPGRLPYLGLALPLGLLGGLLLFVLARAVRPADFPRRDDGWLVTGGVAALAAHLSESMLSLPTASGELLFWVLVGWLIATPKGPGPGFEAPLRAEEAGLLGGVAVGAVSHAPLLMPSLASSLRLPALWLLLPAAWLAGDVLPGEAPLLSGRRSWLRLIGWGVLALGIQASRSIPGASAAIVGALLTAALVGLALTIGHSAPSPHGQPPGKGGSAHAGVSRPQSGQPSMARSAALPALLALLLLAGGWRWVAAPILADSHIRYGLEVAARGDRATARRHFTRAMALWPDQTAYAEYLAAIDRDVLVAAETPSDVRADAFRVADSVLAAAYERVPDPLVLMRRAMLWRDWGDVAAAPEDRQAAWAEAERFFQRARGRAPRSPRLLCEHAKLMERVGDARRARDAYSQAAWLDPGLAEAWAGDLRLALARGGLAEARMRLDEALSPGGVAADELVAALAAAQKWPIDQRAVLGSLVLYYRRVGRLTDATAALRALREFDPDDPMVAELEQWLKRP